MALLTARMLPIPEDPGSNPSATFIEQFTVNCLEKRRQLNKKRPEWPILKTKETRRTLNQFKIYQQLNDDWMDASAKFPSINSSSNHLNGSNCLSF